MSVEDGEHGVGGVEDIGVVGLEDVVGAASGEQMAGVEPGVGGAGGDNGNEGSHSFCYLFIDIDRESIK